MSGGVIGVGMDGEGDDDFCGSVGFDGGDELGDAGVCLVAVGDGDECAEDEVVSLYDGVC